ncbi:MAG: hypothetical protein KJ880_06145, partial [Candidatus Omnitrophica bacterium]|nr:hypothetical protein [Candidatus Omnitrophota bacterium]
NKIFLEIQGAPESSPVKTPSATPVVISRDQAMDQAFDLARAQAPGGLIYTSFDEKEKKKRGYKVKGITITGDTMASFGVTPDEFIWKRANADMNEKNWRILSDANYNRKSNTFDTRVYDSMNVYLDTDNKEGFNFHSNLTVDPWSFTGKSDKTTINTAWGDVAEVQLKYWSNTGYSINETYYTQRLGDSFALPELKVRDYKTDSVYLNGAFIDAFTGLRDSFTIPGLNIHRTFQPVRELWVDYQKESSKLRVFPMAYQDQAYTSDDPLRLSNNRIWWQESPWIDQWQSGWINTGVTPNNYFRGRYDDTLAYYTRDSNGKRLTALRGASFQLAPNDDFLLDSTIATPKTLWQDYDNVDNIINATRAKYRVSDGLSIGALYTYRMGLNEQKKRDSTNYVYSTDIGFEPIEGTKFTAELAQSRNISDMAIAEYKTKANGNAYQFSVTGVYPRQNIMDLKYGYDELKPEKAGGNFTKYRFFAARMDAGFRPTLSNYRETRDDSYWSRHIHFRKPLKYYFEEFSDAGMAWDDISPYAIGNGIDIGRSVLGFRIENVLFDERLQNLFDVRNVHKSNSNKFVENVARDEATFKVTDKLTSKFLFIYHKLPKTAKNVDPFIFDTDYDINLTNEAIEDGMNPTIKTGSMGMEYAFTDKVSLSGIWERTNDYTLAYDNFPRGALNESSMITYGEYGRTFSKPYPFLYDQSLFPLPPYSFYNIWKSGLKFNPTDKMEINLDYTRNEFESAGQIDDNINHVGMDFSYLPNKKMGFFFRYTYSRWNDLSRMVDGYDKIYLGHHNFFTEFKYLPTLDDEFSFQYGESGISPLTTVSYDPFGGSLATLDTRHIIRCYYRRKF